MHAVEVSASVVAVRTLLVCVRTPSLRRSHVHTFTKQQRQEGPSFPPAFASLNRSTFFRSSTSRVYLSCCRSCPPRCRCLDETGRCWKNACQSVSECSCFTDGFTETLWCLKIIPSPSPFVPWAEPIYCTFTAWLCKRLVLTNGGKSFGGCYIYNFFVLLSNETALATRVRSTRAV